MLKLDDFICVLITQDYTKIFENSLQLLLLVHFISYFTRRACEARVLKCCSNPV